MATKNIWLGLDDLKLEGHTVVIPSVAVGNVAQLACDLLISSLNMKKVASVYSPALIPVLGYDPYKLNSDEPSTSCEIYTTEKSKIVVIQFRAPLIYKYAKSFLTELIETLKRKSISDIVIVTSSFAYENRQILSSPYRYKLSETSIYKDKMSSFSGLPHNADGSFKIPGGGIATMLYKVIEEQNLPCFLLYKYCSEGDNRPDAYNMMSQLTSLLPHFKDKTFDIIEPVSWKFLFGRPPPQDIY